MEKLIEKIQKGLRPFATAISKNKFLNSVGTTFQLLLPIIMIGSFAALGAFLDIEAWQTFIARLNLGTILMSLHSLSLSLIALYVVIVLSYDYSKKLNLNPISSMVSSIMVFLVITPHEIYTSLPMDWFGYPGLFGALIVSLVVPLLTKFLIDKKIYIRMPKGVPPIVEDSFASIVPTLISVIVAVIVSGLMAKTSFGNLHQLIYTIIQTPLSKVGLSFSGYLLMQVVATLLMFSGIHGNTVFALYIPLTMAASAENLAAMASNQALPNIITSSFSVFCQPGGIGGTFGLAFLLAFVAKSKRLNTLGKISIIPAIFGINEPLIFGVPILLNPLLFIPYILNPIIATSISYFSMYFGVVPYPTGVDVNWTMPQFVSGFLAQGWQSAVLQVVLVIVTTMIGIHSSRL